MRQPHRKQLLAAALLLTHLPVSVLSEEIIEKSIQTEATKQNEQKTDEEPILPDFSPEETGEPAKPPVSQEPNETPESGEQSVRRRGWAVCRDGGQRGLTLLNLMAFKKKQWQIAKRKSAMKSQAPKIANK